MTYIDFDETENIGIDYCEFIKHAYALSKQNIYFEKTDLFKRYKFAEFEANDFPNNLNKISQQINNLIHSNNDEILDYWLNSINVKFLPKSIEKTKSQNESEKGVFLSNYRAASNYKLEKVNYFIDACVPIHIISMLWVLLVGKLLDDKINSDCLGNRLENFTLKRNPIPSRVFKLYFGQYEKWRDKAIETGLFHLNSKTNIILISLDIKECFYRIKIDYKEINRLVKKSELGFQDELLRLNSIIEKINLHYLRFLKKKNFIDITHNIDPFSDNEVRGLPIGLPSSSVLSNWSLSKLDDEIKEKISPLYYGRYVDDILIVLRCPENIEVENNNLRNQIIDKLFIKNGVLDKDGGVLNFVFDPKFLVQDNKIIIHYYDSNFSYAGLKDFKKELEKRASEFKFLPTNEKNQDLTECAYDLTFNGSINKLRNLVGISENDSELKIFLEKKLIEYRLCQEVISQKEETIDQIFKFFRGRNMFDFCRTWERVFNFLILDTKKEGVKNIELFYDEAKDTIKKLLPMKSDKNRNVFNKVIVDSLDYLHYSLCTPLGLLSKGFKKEKEVLTLTNSICKNENRPYHGNIEERYENEIIKTSILIRESNLIRHKYVSWPLLNYSHFSGNLINFNFSELNSKDFPSLVEEDINFNETISQNKWEYSPRFIHLDEYQLYKYLETFVRLKNVNEAIHYKNSSIIKRLFNSKNSNKEKYPNCVRSRITKTKFDSINIAFNKKKNNEFENNEQLQIKIVDKYKKPHSKNNFVIGVANMKIIDEDIIRSYNPSKLPNLSYKRQSTIYSLLNEGNKTPKCDLIVLPEVSIPYSWLPFMVNHARRNDIGLIFGLEHWVINQYALNFVATILPFRNNDDYHNCFVSLRIKNHYSPKEIFNLKTFRLEKPKVKYQYERFIWRGISFTTYNCFELSDILHRGLFRSDIDLLIAVEWNQDTNYYSNILESCIRDIHCYMVQVNTSQFGDSRISAPKKTEEMNILRVTGGDNDILIKGSIDINALRQFQLKEYDPLDKRFKPTPAGYNHENVLRRNDINH